MKKTGLIIVLCALSSGVFAQKGFYFSASAGGGIGGSTKKFSSTASKSTIAGYKAQLSVGYQFNKLRFQTGLQYCISGFKLSGLSFGSDFDPNKNPISAEGTYHIIYTHFGVPIQVGYVLRSAKKLKIVPFVGTLTTYNIGATSDIKSPTVDEHNEWSKDDYNKSFNRISVWGITGVQLEYAVNKGISIIGGPDFQFGLTKLDKAAYASQHNLTADLNLGVKVNL